MGLEIVVMLFEINSRNGNVAGELSWLEHRTHKPGVGGSNPPPATKKSFFI